MWGGGGENDTLASPDDSAPVLPRPDPAAATHMAFGDHTLDPIEAAERTPEGPAWIGRFVIFEELGAGGMGQVFAAYDPELDRKVALKLVQRAPDGAKIGDWQTRLVREAQAMAKLSHPNVVTVYEVGAHAGHVFLAMELVQGRDLARWLITPRSWQSILEVFRAAGEGLAAAHAVGLVHRDFKPANVLVGDDGRVRVADFGLVHMRTARELALRDSGSHTSDVFARELTHFGALMGTPAYMAPEQLSGEDTDARSDVFSFCVALWEAIHGLRPFGGDSLSERLEAIRRGEIREPTHTTAPRWLRPLLLKGLSEEPGDRWPSMRALLDALARDPERERARRRRGALRVVAVLALGGALVYGGSLLWSHLRASARESAAQQHLDVTLAHLAARSAEGRTVEVDAIVDAFVADPDHTGTRAQVQALRWRADQRRERGDLDGALEAYSEAYAAAHDPDDAGEVLLGLATLFRERRAWGPLTWVLASLADLGAAFEAPSEALRVDAAMYRRDFATVAAIDPSLAPLAAALGQARRTGQRAARAATVDLDGDGDPELALFATSSPSPRITLTRRDADLTPLFTSTETGLRYDRVVRTRRPGRAHMIAGAGDHLRHLLGWRDGKWTIEASWPGSIALTTASGDLDGDGDDEIYVGTGPYQRRLLGLRRAGEGWSVFTPSPTIDAAASDVMALAIGDLDGDGRDELVVGLGAWQAFDLRVLRPGPPGQPFELVARHKLGVVECLAIVATPEGPLIAVAKNHETLYASPLMFPEGDHTGVASGLYLFRLRGRSLEQVAFAPIEASAHLVHLEVADLDGDGRAELLGDIAPLAGGPHDLEIFRISSDARLSRLRVGHLQLLLATDLDADPEGELLVTDEQDDGRVWALGVGAQQLAALDLGRPKLAALPPAALADDASLSRQWVHAGELAGLGLLAAASRRYVELARALPRGEVRRAALVQAAELAASAGDLERAATQFEAAARLASGPGAATLFERAADDYERVGRFDDAIRVLGEIERPSATVQTRLARHVEWLASEREYGFERPLDPVWKLLDPLVLLHDRIHGALIADVMGPEPTLALPLQVEPDFVLRVELSVAELSYGGSFALRVQPADPGAAPIEVSAYRSGSGGSVGAKLFVRLIPADPSFSIPLPGPADRVVLEVSQRSASREQRLTLTLNDVLIGETRRSIDAVLTGPARLELLRSDPLGGPVRANPWTRVELHRVVTRGLTIDPAPPDPWDEARRALVEGEHARALAAIAVAEGTAPPPADLPVWTALALQGAADGPAAVRTLGDALDLRTPDAPAYRSTVRLLSARGERFAPLLRAALGPGYLQLFYDAWIDALRNEQFGDPLMRAFLEHAPDLELVHAADVPGLDAPLQDVEITLRLARAAIYARIQDSASAHREFARVDPAIAARIPDTKTLLRGLLLRLAVLDLADNRIDHVFEHLTTARALASPEMFADMLRADPELTALHSDPRWRGLLGE